MLEDLIVEGLGVIQRAEVHLSRGSTVVTGETGAGKTMIVAALGLLLGERADRGAIRQGSSEALIQGRFIVSPEHPCVPLLRGYDLLDGSEGEEQVEVIVSRRITADGSKARVNGRLVTLGILSEVVGRLVEIAGQNQHQALASSTVQRRTLDRAAGPEALSLASSVATLFSEGTEALEKGRELRSRERERSREIEVLTSEIAEISAAGLVEGEWARLTADARRSENAEEIAAGLSNAMSALHDEGGIEDAMSNAERVIRDVARLDPDLITAADRLEKARIEVVDIASELAARRNDPEGASLAEIRSRLDVISKLQRKYGDDESAILEYLARAERRVAELEGAASEAESWLEAGEKKLAEAREAAEALSAIRERASEELSRTVEERLAALAMPGASFMVELQPRDLYGGGLETVVMKASANSGAKARPISKAVSGGELSRIALALHLASTPEDASLLVFDEVDAGVGGRAALEIGRALADLATRTCGQVLVVTHLPQVAAFADNHLRVVKTDDGSITSASVAPVESGERVEELSRMLAGMPESEGGRKHAEELLELAGRPTGAAT